MAELKAADAPAWSQFVRDFDGAVKSFNDNRAALITLGPYLQAKHPELIPQWRSMLTRADAIAPTLQTLAQTRSAVSGWIGSLGNVYASTVDLTSRAIEQAAEAVAAARRALGLGDLGIAPLVAIGLAAAGGALIVVTKWVSDAYVMAKRLNAMQDLEAKGYTPSEAAAAVNGVLGSPNAPGGIERTLSNILWVAALVGIGLYIVPRLLDPPRRSKR